MKITFCEKIYITGEGMAQLQMKKKNNNFLMKIMYGICLLAFSICSHAPRLNESSPQTQTIFFGTFQMQRLLFPPPGPPPLIQR